MSRAAVIGLEVHVQLATRTKLFCADRAEFGAAPNTHVCPVCLGLPGALPVANRRAVELAVRAGLALGCQIHERSVFARKSYFYPDLPKGYQITQAEHPLCTGGALAAPADGDAEAPVPVRIRRVHLEEDAGKLVHDAVAGRTAVDLNRAGVPLIEIVTEPDLVSPAHARAFLIRLKQLLEYLEVGDCDMEKGSLRVDANVSILPAGARQPGARTEIKNLNSFAGVERALDYEIRRQREVVERGGAVAAETLLWDAARGVARPMRAKSAGSGYRYAPDPDLPPLVVDAAMVEAVRAALPELPADRRRRFRTEYGLPDYDAGVLTATRELADYFEGVVRAGAAAKQASNWVMTEVLAWANRHACGVSRVPVGPDALAGLLRLVEEGTVSVTAAREAFARMAESGEPAERIVEAHGLARVGDAERIEAWAAEVVAEDPEAADRFRAGEARLFGYFMGRLMRRSGGRADPGRAAAALRARLGRSDN